MEDIIIVFAIIGFYIFLMYKKFQKQQRQQAAKRKMQPQAPQKPTLGDLLDDILDPKPEVERRLEPEPEVAREPVYSSRPESVRPQPQQRPIYNPEPAVPHHFSYDENISAEGFSYDTDTSAKRGTETLMNADDENQEENTPILSFEPEELYKGFIYSEVFKNPYNQ